MHTDVQQKINELEFLRHKPYLSKAEYRTLWGVSIPTIDRLIRAGDIQCKKIGASVRIANELAR